VAGQYADTAQIDADSVPTIESVGTMGLVAIALYIYPVM